MWKMIDKRLTLGVPSDLIKADEKKELFEKMEKCYGKVLEWGERFIPEEYEEQYQQVLKADLLNSIFLSSVIDKMLKEDIVFSVAVQKAKEAIEADGKGVEALFDMLELSSDLKEIIETTIKDIAKELMPIVLPIYMKDHEAAAFVMVKINFKIYNMLVSGEFNDVLNIISNADEIRNHLDEKLITPLRTSMDEFFEAQKQEEEEEKEPTSLSEIIDSVFDKMEKARKNSKKEKAYASIEEYYTTIPLQKMLSIVLREAIEKDITFSAALKQVDFNKVIKEVSDKIMKDDFEGFEEICKKMLKLSL